MQAWRRKPTEITKRNSWTAYSSAFAASKYKKVASRTTRMYYEGHGRAMTNNALLLPPRFEAFGLQSCVEEVEDEFLIEQG